MKNSQNAKLGKMLLNGEAISKGKSMKMGIGSVHSRMIALGNWIRMETHINLFETSHNYEPIDNLGSDTGVKAGGPYKTNQAVFYLPKKYRPALKKALKKRGLL